MERTTDAFKCVLFCVYFKILIFQLTHLTLLLSRNMQRIPFFLLDIVDKKVIKFDSNYLILSPKQIYLFRILIYSQRMAKASHRNLWIPTIFNISPDKRDRIEYPKIIKCYVKFCISTTKYVHVFLKHASWMFYSWQRASTANVEKLPLINGYRIDWNLIRNFGKVNITSKGNYFIVKNNWTVTIYWSNFLIFIKKIFPLRYGALKLWTMVKLTESKVITSK